MARRSQTDFRILAVDDEADTLQFYRDFFSSLGDAQKSDTRLDALEIELFGRPESKLPSQQYNVEFCSQGDTAVEFVERANAENKPFAVLFLDVRMPPGPDGIWTAQEIRKIDPQVNIVLVTGFSDIDPVAILEMIPPPEKLLYLRKPLYPEEIRHFAASLTDKWKTERALKESEERYALATRGTNDGLWDWDLRSSSVFYSHRWAEIVGRDRDVITDDPEEWRRLIHPDDIETFDGDFHNHLGSDSATFENEHRLLHKNNSYIYVLCRGLAVRDQSGKPYRVAGSITDITGRKRAEEKLLHDALFDSLTGLYNRAHFMQRLENTLAFARRHDDYYFAVLFLDLDRFKLINDSLGHLAGDRLLTEVAGRLKKCSRKYDTVARLEQTNAVARMGGDEFIMLLQDIKDSRNAVQVAERVAEEFIKPFTIDDREYFTSASIGIVIGTDRYAKPVEVLRDADIAMYRAKNTGTGNYRVFDESMHHRAVKLLKMETELKKAIEKREFRLHYQPIVSSTQKSIVGFESLIRWYHPKRGIVGPNEFIALAEENDIILPLSRWALEEACIQLRSWQAKLPSSSPYVSVNISSSQFSDPDMVREISDVVEKSDIEASRVKLEITESVLMAGGKATSDTLEGLNSLGLDIYIDDFGTGYSSLSYLLQFPVHSLKIDRSFIENIYKTNRSLEIIKTILVLAQNLNIKVIAEGVETDTQADLLAEHGCEYLQGFFFSKPLSPEDAFKLLDGDLPW
ncbi:MAG: diguanylate cyclase [Spirochaetales bacterium]|nr:diguanylate cyclase [Spirochaetales bacterium]